jgi:hypothetical protein
MYAGTLAGATINVEYDEPAWDCFINSTTGLIYEASATSDAKTPIGLSGWTVATGSGDPVIAGGILGGVLMQTSAGNAYSVTVEPASPSLPTIELPPGSAMLIYAANGIGSSYVSIAFGKNGDEIVVTALGA